MRFLLLGTVVLGAAAGLAGAAGCSEDEATNVTPGDGGSDTSTTAADATPPSHGDTGGPLDCTKDNDLDGVKKHLACAGLYEDFAAKTVASDVKEFTPALQFWSDGAEKRRWVKLPTGAKIDATNFDEWIYPEGTQLW